MDNLQNDRAVMGDNNPPLIEPELLGQCKAKVSEFSAKATEWLELGEIQNGEQSGLLVDFITGARQVTKRIDEARVSAKRPYDDRAKAVQAAFAPMLDEIDRCVTRLKPMQAAWLRIEQARLDAGREEKRRAAEELRQQAEAAELMAKANNSIGGEIEAERLTKEADDMQKAADREVKAQAKSASGAGRTMSTRKIKVAKINNQNAVYMFFRDRIEVADILQRLANGAVRAGQVVPGTMVDEVESAA
ncbi:hypothetical protein [Cypionkella sp.]|uniref:hypothetical protein n=1 Tax=Cypionkella sp. TaxID=2811411 RepID=UPI00271B8FEE|nr:hypothetical protein [Cypionkella sp.]MDO8986078.1 hypothetical protein [Cypionkella sp.]